jgi:hypothetical protein
MYFFHYFSLLANLSCRGIQRWIVTLEGGKEANEWE